MTDKEVITIDGKKEPVKVLFKCNHIADLAAFDMLKKGIKITPENAPVSDFELMLVENTDGIYGFTPVCKRSSKEDVWEYMGFGHSGASSIVTALLKELKRKEQELEISQHYNNELTKYILNIGNLFKLPPKMTILGKNCIEYYAILSASIKSSIKDLQTENEELKEKTHIQENIINNLNNEVDDAEKELDRYKQALEEVKTLIKAAVDPEQTPDAENSLDVLYEALDIITEVMKERNEK